MKSKLPLHAVVWITVPFMPLTGLCQSIWTPMHLPGCQLYQQVVAAEQQERCYFFGVRSPGQGCGTLHSEVYAWESGAWDSITALPGTLSSMVLYHDTLILGGSFNSIGEPDDAIRCYYDGQLFGFGSFNNGIQRLKVIEDTLWAVGGFTQVDGQPASGVAKRVNGGWVPVGSMLGEALVLDIVKYQGELIATGPCYSVGGHRGIYRLEGGSWNLLGEALVGFASTASQMIEYEGVLYIAGQISAAEGNPGHAIIRWDGSAYAAVGGGLLWSASDYSTLTGVTALSVYEGLLYCAGGFNYAGQLSSRGIAAWDGTNWCSVKGDFMETTSDYVSGMAFLGDSLYVGCGPNVDDTVAGFAAHAPLNDLIDQCDMMGVSEVGVDAQGPSLALEYRSYQLSVTSIDDMMRDYRLLDTSGRELASGAVNSNRLVIECNPFGSGCYILVVRTGAGRISRKFMLH